jgi:hypothetical protein
VSHNTILSADVREEKDALEIRSLPDFQMNLGKFSKSAAPQEIGDYNQ